MIKQLKSCVIAAVAAVFGGPSAWAEVALPADYTPLDYIESTGTQYIKTGVNAKPNLESEIEIEFLDRATEEAVLGVMLDTTAKDSFSHYLLARKSGQFSYRFGTGWPEQQLAGDYECNRKYKIVTAMKSGAQSLTVDGVLRQSTTLTSSGYTSSREMYLFGRQYYHTSATFTSGGRMRIYSCKITDGDFTNVLRDFVPCRDPDGVAGLWDRVSGTFFGNDGTGRFIGSDGEDADEVLLDYLESTGTQYIKTGVIAKPNLESEIEIEFLDRDTNEGVLGLMYDKGGDSFSHYLLGRNSGCLSYRFGNGYPDHQLAGEYELNRKYKIVTAMKSGAQSLTVDDVERKTSTLTSKGYSKSLEMYLFGRQYYNTKPEFYSGGKMRIYSCKITDGDFTHVLRDYVPRMMINGCVGMYDRVNGDLIQNAGTGNFGFGIAYTTDGTTICIREGRLADGHCTGWSAAEKTSCFTLDATSVSGVPVPLAHRAGKITFLDGEAKVFSVGGTLALTGGARLAIDLSATENDSFTVGAIDLSAASAENPVIVEIAPVGVTALGVDEVRPLISGAGLALELADGDAQKFKVKGFAAQVAVRDGALVLIKTDPEDAVWTGAAAPDTTWSNADNWEVAPETGANVRFNLSAGGTTTLDQPYAVKNVIFGADAGAFTHGGTDVLSVQAGIENASASAQTFSMPMAFGTVGVPFEFAATGDLALTDGAKTAVADEFVKTGAGTLALNDDTVSAAAKVTVSNGTLRLVNTGKTTAAATAGEIRIADGARLDLNVDGGNSTNLAKTEATHGKTVYVEGSGPNGESAIINSNPANAYGANFGRLVATGDAKVGGSGRIGVRPLPGSQIPGSAIEGAGTLHILGAGAFEQGQDQVSVTSVECAIGGIVVERGGYFQFDGSANGTVTNGVTLADGSFMRLYQSTVSEEIPVVVPAEASALLKSAYLASTLKGAMRIDGELTTQNGSGATLTLAGTLSGNGSLKGNALGFSGAASRWEMSADDRGFTSKVDIDGQSNANLLVGLHEIAVTYTGNPAEKHDFEIGPAGALTATAAAQVVLSVRDAQCAAIPNCWLGIANGKLILHLNDTNVVRTAVLTGRGVDPNDYTDPANWACSNDVGSVVADGLPMAVTTVIVPGANCTFNCPAGAALATCREITFTYPVTLAADCDWRGLLKNLVIDGTIDLNGHKLYVASLNGAADAAIWDYSGYELLDYIESTGTQYIKTGVDAKPNLGAEIEIEFLDRDTNEGVLGVMFDTTLEASFKHYLLSRSSGQLAYCFGNGYPSAQLAGEYELNRKYKIVTAMKSGAQSLKVDDVERKTSSLTSEGYSTSLEMYLFGRQYYHTSPEFYSGGKMRIYRCKITDGDDFTNVLRDFVPARRKDDGAIGMLDLANDQFYENAGSGEFLTNVTTPVGDYTVGELHIDVRQGTTVRNEAVALRGPSLRLVKEGAGTFVPAKYNQTYAGGNVVKAGLLQLNNPAMADDVTYAMAQPAGKQPIGATGGEPVVVMSNAVYDINGVYNSYLVPVELEGGTLRNTKKMTHYTDWGACGNVSVTAEGSILDAAASTVFSKGRGASNIDLGGHELTVKIAGSSRLYLKGGITNGTFSVISGGWLQFGEPFDASTADIVSAAAFSCQTSFSVRNLTPLWTGNNKEGTGTVRILGAFTPNAANYLNNFVLQDGATLNLANREGVYDIATSVTGQTLGFADNAMIYVLPHWKSGQIVDWTDHAPDNLDTLTFKCALDEQGSIIADENGIFYKKGLTIIFR